MLTGLLPIGTVVLLKDSTKRVMIMGVVQMQKEKEKVWDYVGVLYPEGFMGPDKTFLFNGEQIEKIYALGYQDEEQFDFKERADKTLAQVRASEFGERI